MPGGSPERAATAQTNVERALGASEALFDAFSRRGLYLPGAIALVEGPLHADLVNAALAHVQRRHPLLRASIVDGPAGARYAPAAAGAPPLRVAAGDAGADPATLLERELHLLHDAPGGPPWRCTFAPAPAPDCLHALAIGASHAIADGLSLTRILADLVGACGALHGGHPLPPALAPELGLEARLRSTPRRALILHKLRRHLGRPGPSPLDVVPPRIRAGPEERRTRVLLRTTAPGTLPLLAARCRAERTSVEGALTAALLGALPPLARTPPWLDVAHQVSLREAYDPPVPPEQVGCFVASTSTRHPLGGGPPFWETARSATDQLRAWRARGTWLATAHGASSQAAPMAARVAERALDAASLGRVSVAGISNCGALEPARGGFAIRELYLAAGIHLVGDLFQLAVAGVDGRLACALAFVAPLVSVETAERLVAAVVGHLDAAAGDGRRVATKASEPAVSSAWL